MTIITMSLTVVIAVQLRLCLILPLLTRTIKIYYYNEYHEGILELKEGLIRDVGTNIRYITHILYALLVSTPTAVSDNSNNQPFFI
jgi:hypothetical protein